MKTEAFVKEKFECAELQLSTSKIDLGAVCDATYFNRVPLYVAHFNELPNSMSMGGIKCEKVRLWLREKCVSEIRKTYTRHRYQSYGTISTDEYIFMYEDLMIFLDTDSSFIRFLYSKTDFKKVEALFVEIKKRFKMKEKRQTPYISLMTQSNLGFNTTRMEIKKPKLSIDDNYNDDFKEIHQIILKRLNQKKDKGLVLLHGKPGTGKTSYIRYLLASLKKEVIFLPPNLATEITNPALMSFLIENPNSVFVIEDAENIVIDREQGGGSAVSALLNLSDGLLSDCLNIQILCSFNTDISKVDSALLRKGRLIAKYEFKELETRKAQTLSNKLGFQTIINQPMTLTAIYNQGEKDFRQTEQKRNVIGFKKYAA